MKKILSLITVLLLVIGLGACAPSQDYSYEDDIKDLQEQIDAQQVEIDALNQRIDDLVVSVGINGQISIYENQSTMYSRMTYLDLKEQDVLDKSKFPDYIWNETGDYVTVNSLGRLLTQKYFGENSTSTTGLQYKISMDIDGLTDAEIIARLSLMIMELSLYDFYTIDSPELYIELINGGSEYVKVRMSLLVSDKYNLVPEVFYEGMLDTRIVGLTFDVTEVEQLITEYQTNGTYDGYVLNYS